MDSSRFSSNPSIIRAAFFLLFGFHKQTPNQKGQKGTTGEPSLRILVSHLSELLS